jgi:glycine/D-amino acid oxidase-like deaminating enzyme
MAYSRHARRLGVRFATRTAVRGIVTKDGRVTGVETDAGPVRCDMVINAAGAHAYHIARLVGLDLPIVPVRHEYFVTVDAPGIRSELPVLRIPDATLYARAEVGSLLLGGWEPSALSVEPAEFSLRGGPPAITPDWEVLAGFADQFAPLFPAASALGIRSVFKGWPTFTPDGRFIIGESSRVKGFVMAGGCNAHGVSGSAGIGRHVVESILEERPSPYVRSLSPDRFTETSWDWPAARRQAQRVYETYYALEH